MEQSQGYSIRPRIIFWVSAICITIGIVLRFYQITSNDFVFYVESWGQLDCKKILLEASKVLGSKLDEFVELLKAAKLTE